MRNFLLPFLENGPRAQVPTIRNRRVMGRSSSEPRKLKKLSESSISHHDFGSNGTPSLGHGSEERFNTMTQPLFLPSVSQIPKALYIIPRAQRLDEDKENKPLFNQQIPQQCANLTPDCESEEYFALVRVLQQRKSVKRKIWIFARDCYKHIDNERL